MRMIIFLSFILVSILANPVSSGQSIEKIINSNWTFNYFPSPAADKGYESPAFDDSRWIAVSLPHTWNTFETTGELRNSNQYWRNGWGWYRKHFTVNQSYSERKVYIELKGVQSYCKVWINGAYLGETEASHDGVDFNVTAHIKNGADNVIAVAVNNSAKGYNYLYGGICSKVSIVLKNRLHIAIQGNGPDAGRPSVSTPGLTEKSGVVKVLTRVRNDNDQPASCTLVTSILDAGNKTIQQVRTTASINKGAVYTFDQTTKPIKDPRIWSRDDPYLYKVVSEIIDGKTIVDSYKCPFRFITESTGKEVASKKDMPAEDTTWIVTDRNIYTGVASEQQGWMSDPDQKIPGYQGTPDPARIVLRSSHSKFPAERASTSVISADLTDREGRKVNPAENTFKWIVTGPAKLIGPSVYEDVFKTGNPLANVIRSTGDPGRIKITVFSPGLASGSIELVAEAVATDNSVVSEPVLRNEGRTGTERVVLKPSRLVATPAEIKIISADLRMSAPGRDGYKEAIRETVAGANPTTDTASVEFRTLIDLLAGQLHNNNGNLSADDFNFNVEHYNLCRLISGYVNATKLPQPFKDGLRIYYSNCLIKKGIEKDAGDEMNWLNWIPSGGTVVYCVENPKAPPQKGTIYTSKNELTDIITLVYPDFVKFTDDGRQRAIEFIDKLNPYVNAVSISEVADGKTVSKTRIQAEKEKPILIPLYKFIAE